LTKTQPTGVSSLFSASSACSGDESALDPNTVMEA
jgi:hypothetical protein